MFSFFALFPNLNDLTIISSNKKRGAVLPYPLSFSSLFCRNKTIFVNGFLSEQVCKFEGICKSDAFRFGYSLSDSYDYNFVQLSQRIFIRHGIDSKRLVKRGIIFSSFLLFIIKS